MSLVFGYLQRWLACFNYLQLRVEVVSAQFLLASLKGAGEPVPGSLQYFPWKLKKTSVLGGSSWFETLAS